MGAHVTRIMSDQPRLSTAEGTEIKSAPWSTLGVEKLPAQGDVIVSDVFTAWTYFWCVASPGGASRLSTQCQS